MRIAQFLLALACTVAADSLRAQTTEAVTLTTPTGSLAGTLQVPTGTGAHPLIVVIAGSGPTDRNGNSLGTPVGGDSYRMLADSLLARGIATLRYDKRGIGGSAAAGGAERDLRFEALAADAAGWVQQYRRDPRFSRVVILGHSEGSLLGMLAMKTSGADAFISVAGPARSAATVLREQLVAALPPALMASSDSILAALVRGDTVASTPPQLASLFRPSVQPYIISWFRYSGQSEIASLSAPVLILQGTHDGQVPASEAALLAAAQPKARVVRVDSMNHVLKITPAPMAEQQRFYMDKTVPVPRTVVAPIAEFVSSLATPSPTRRPRR